MHDWTFHTLTFDWETGNADLHFSSYTDACVIVQCIHVKKLHLPREEEWGPSTAVYEYEGPTKLDDNHYIMTIQMQTGDEIEITAERFICEALNILTN